MSEQRVRDAVPDALRLVDVVHSESDGRAAVVETILAGADLPALCVVLAAMVDDGRPHVTILDDAGLGYLVVAYSAARGFHVLDSPPGWALALDADLDDEPAGDRT